MLDLCTATLDELLQVVPKCVADAIVEGRGDGGPPVQWEEALQRLYYSARTQQQGLYDEERGYSMFVPQDQRVLQELGVVISTDLRPASPASGPWWAQPFQRLSPPGCPPDDAFPAEFRGYILDHAASLPSAGQPNVLPPDRELFFTYMFAQMRYSDPVKGTYTYMGYKLSRSTKERLFTRWAREYPELSENVLAAWDVPRDLSPSTSSSPAAQPYYEAQARKFRNECWAALQRRGALPPAAVSTSDQVPPPLPDWLGASGPGLVAGSRIPHDLRDLFRIDPYGNVVAHDAEAQSICAWDVDHVFPRKRGGRSVLQNFVATHWYANRHVKTEKLLCTIVLTKDGRNPLTCGLTEPGLVQLWSARHLLPAALQTTPAFKQLLIALLCTNWRRGADSKELFNTRVGLLHVTPVDQLFVVLLQEFQAATTTLVAGWHVGLLASASLPAAAADVPADPPARRSHHGRTASAFVLPSSPTKSGRPAAEGLAREVLSRQQFSAKHSRTSSEGGMPDVDTHGDQVLRDGDQLSSSRMVEARSTGSVRTRMGPLPSGQLLPYQGAGKLKPVSPETAVKVFNQVIALAQETDLPELSQLPQIADLHVQGGAAQRGKGAAGIAAGRDKPAAGAANTRDDGHVLKGYGDAALMMGEAFYAQVMQPAAPKPVRKARPRMSSAATQTAAGLGDTASSLSTASSAPSNSKRPTSSAGAKPKDDEGSQGKEGSKVVPEPEAQPAPAGTEAPAAAPLPPGAPACVKLPVYSPPHCPVRSHTPPRPRNPLADPFITEAYDLRGPAAPGSSLTSRGIIQAAVDEILAPELKQRMLSDDQDNSQGSSLNSTLQAPDGGVPSNQQGYFWCPEDAKETHKAKVGMYGPPNMQYDVSTLHHVLHAAGQSSYPMSIHQSKMITTYASLETKGKKQKKAVLHLVPPAAGQPYIVTPDAPKPYQSAVLPPPPPGMDIQPPAAGVAAGYMEQRKHKKVVRHTWELAQIGVIAPGPLWPGGPWPLSNPHLGPGSAHPQLLHDLEAKGKEAQGQNQWLSVQGPAPVTMMQQHHDLGCHAAVDGQHPALRMGVLGPYCVVGGEGNVHLENPYPGHLSAEHQAAHPPAASSNTHAAGQGWEQQHPTPAAPAYAAVPMQIDPTVYHVADYSRLVPAIQPWPSPVYHAGLQQPHYDRPSTAAAPTAYPPFWASPEAAVQLWSAAQGYPVPSTQLPYALPPQPAAWGMAPQAAYTHMQQAYPQPVVVQHVQHVPGHPQHVPSTQEREWAVQMLRAALQARTLHHTGRQADQRQPAAGRVAAVGSQAQAEQQQALQMLRAAMVARLHKQHEAARVHAAVVQPQQQAHSQQQLVAGPPAQDQHMFALQMLQAAMAARAQHHPAGSPGPNPDDDREPAQPQGNLAQDQTQFALQMLQAALAARAQHPAPSAAAAVAEKPQSEQQSEADQTQFALQMLQAAMAARPQHQGSAADAGQGAVRTPSSGDQAPEAGPDQFALQMLQAAMAARASKVNRQPTASQPEQDHYALHMLQAAMAARAQHHVPTQAPVVPKSPEAVAPNRLTRQLSRHNIGGRGSTEGYQQWLNADGSVARTDSGIRYEALWPSSPGLSRDSLGSTSHSAAGGTHSPAPETLEPAGLVTPTKPTAPSTSASPASPLPGPAWSSPLPTSPLGRSMLSEEDLPPPAFNRTKSPASPAGSGKKKRTGMKRLSAGAKQAMGKLRVLLGIKSTGASGDQGASEAVLNIGHLPMSLESVAEEEEEVEDARQLSPTAHVPASAFATSQVVSTSPGRSDSPSKRLLQAATKLVSKLSASKGVDEGSVNTGDAATGRPLTKEVLHAHGSSTPPAVGSAGLNAGANGGSLMEEADQRTSPASSEANPLMQTIRSRGKQATLRASLASLNSSASSTTRLPSAPGLPQADSNTDGLHELLPPKADAETPGSTLQARSRERRSVKRM